MHYESSEKGQKPCAVVHQESLLLSAKIWLEPCWHWQSQKSGRNNNNYWSTRNLHQEAAFGHELKSWLHQLQDTWTHTMGKSPTNVISVSTRPPVLIVFWDIKGTTVERSQTNATNVTTPHFTQAIWTSINGSIVRIDPTNASIVI